VLFNERLVVVFTKRGRQRIRVQGRQAGRIRNTKDRTTGKRHGTIDDNPTGDKGKTQYIGGGKQVYDIRKCRELNNQDRGDTEEA